MSIRYIQSEGIHVVVGNGNLWGLIKAKAKILSFTTQVSIVRIEIKVKLIVSSKGKIVKSRRNMMKMIIKASSIDLSGKTEDFRPNMFDRYTVDRPDKASKSLDG